MSKILLAAAALAAGLSSAAMGAELLTNGNFEGGLAGFTSDYRYSPGDLGPPDVFDVLTNPHNDHPAFAVMGDHTTGVGKMMVINGAQSPLIVWREGTLAVAPNTTYVFSFWLATVYPQAPAVLSPEVNGVALTPAANASGTVALWTPFTYSWFSGGHTTATVALRNLNTAFSGNDFALDDLSFASVAAGVPEPAAWALLLTGFLALGAALRRRATA
jgi:hypothetical protein